MSSVIHYYESTTYKNILITDELLDLLGSEFLKRADEHTKKMNFEQFVEYKLWNMSRTLQNKLKKSAI